MKQHLGQSLSHTVESIPQKTKEKSYPFLRSTFETTVVAFQYVLQMSTAGIPTPSLLLATGVLSTEGCTGRPVYEAGPVLTCVYEAKA